MKDFKNFPLSKYKYVIIPEKQMIIAITTYAGKTVKGVARCHDNDVWNEEIGKKIAAYKCNLKVQKKRLESLYASKAYTEMAIDFYVENLNQLEVLIDAATEALDDAVNKLDTTIDET